MNQNSSYSRDGLQGPPSNRPTFSSAQFIPSNNSSSNTISNSHPILPNPSLITPASRLLNPLSFVEWNGLKFLIMDAPSPSNLDIYIKEMRNWGVKEMVRLCDSTYSADEIRRASINLHELVFPDGDNPPEHIIEKWLELVFATFGPLLPARKSHCSGSSTSVNGSSSTSDISGLSALSVPVTRRSSPSPPLSSEGPTIAVHCVAGLGRAPILVAIALIEHGMSSLDAVTFLREKRRGALNNKQLRFLESYRRRNRGSSLFAGGKCTIM